MAIKSNMVYLLSIHYIAKFQVSLSNLKVEGNSTLKLKGYKYL